MCLLQIQILSAHEPWIYTKGWIVTLAGFLIVIVALIILSFIFSGVATYFSKKDAKKIAPEQKNVSAAIRNTAPKPVKTVKEGDIPSEMLAAIGMALYLSTNLHDEESNILTIERRQTSWNDKSYGVKSWDH